LSRSPKRFYVSISVSLMTKIIIIPVSVALCVTAILRRAARDGEDKSHRMLELMPYLCDFSYENHQHLSHVDRMALQRPWSDPSCQSGAQPPVSVPQEFTHEESTVTVRACEELSQTEREMTQIPAVQTNGKTSNSYSFWHCCAMVEKTQPDTI